MITAEAIDAAVRDAFLKVIGREPFQRAVVRREHPNDSRRAAIVSAIRAGRQYKDIGAQFGISRQRVHQYAKASSITRRSTW